MAKNRRHDWSGNPFSPAHSYHAARVVNVAIQEVELIKRALSSKLPGAVKKAPQKNTDPLWNQKGSAFLGYQGRG